jgi:hypothetical protein
MDTKLGISPSGKNTDVALKAERIFRISGPKKSNRMLEITAP